MIVALAFSLSAYTNLPKKEVTGYYWFPLNSFSGDPQAVSTLVYQSYDPYLCTNWAPGGYCSGAFTSYTRIGTSYVAAGTEVLLHFSLFY